MKPKPWQSGATTGSIFEATIDKWANDAGIPYNNDTTLTNSKRRRKDLKSDRIYIWNCKEIAVELKTTTEKQQLDYALYDDGRQHKIKWHQICKADYFIMEFRPNDPLLIKKTDFLKWACHQKKNSIGYKDALSIGEPITSMEWIKELE